MNTDPFRDVRDTTAAHRRQHGCSAYLYREGPLLAAVAAMTRAQRIVEVGTALGHSALWLAHGAPDAQVDTIEADAGHVRLARAELARHVEGARVEVHHGAAESVLPTLAAGVYDVAFFDGHTPSAAILELLRERLRTGGVLVAANLTHGVAPAVLADLEDPARWLTASLGETALCVRRERR